MHVFVFVRVHLPIFLYDETGMPPTGSIKYYSLEEIFFFRLR